MQRRKTGGVTLPDSAVTRTKEISTFGGASHRSIFGRDSGAIFAVEMQSFQLGGKVSPQFLTEFTKPMRVKGCSDLNYRVHEFLQKVDSHVSGNVSAGHCIMLAGNDSKTTYDMRKQVLLLATHSLRSSWFSPCSFQKLYLQPHTPPTSQGNGWSRELRPPVCLG